MILVDATPLQTEHRYRGPGAYTAGLLDALTREPLPPRLGLLLQSPRPADLPIAATLSTRAGVDVVRLHRPRWPRYRGQWLLSQMAVRPALRRARPCIYHATDPNGLVALPGTAVVATLYDLIPLRYPGAHFPLRRLDQRLGYARYLRLLQRADRIIAISAATRHDAVERLGIAPERIAVTPLAVDEEQFLPLPAEYIDRVLSRHGLRRPYFLHVGAATFHKNTNALMRAFDLFRRRGGVHALYVAGRWTPRALARIRALYPDLLEGGHLRILGFVADDDLAAMYGGATALAYPSVIEGFGLPVLESMRCATPVLTSNTSSLPEVGGDAALYVDPHSPEEIAEGLRRLADDPSLRADLVERGLRHAQAFTWSRTAQATWRIYQELL